MIVRSSVNGYSRLFKLLFFVLDVTHEAEDIRVEVMFSDVAVNVCESFVAAMLFSLLFLIM